MANKLKFKRGLAAGIPNGDAAEPLFTTDTYDLYIGKGDGTNQRFQKYIASGATTQILRGDGSLYTFPLAISSPVAGQVLKYNGTSWTNDSDTDTGITTLNTLTATTQTFATGTSGTDFNISSATSTHTFNIPTASATNRGALSSADWTTFNSKIGGSGTSGQVAYFNGTSSITSESNLFWDAANDRLGIGTITPGASLAVNGNAFFAAKITIKGNAAGTLGNSSGLELYQDAVTDTSYLYNFYNGPLLLGTNNTERVRIASSGNVGIGTTGPVLRLDVQGNASDTATISGVTVEQVSLFRPSNGVGGIRTGFNTSTGDVYLWSSNSGSSLNFGTRSAPNNTAHLSIAFTGAATFSSTTTATAFIPSGSSVPTNGMYLPTTNTLAWATNTTERMRLDASGRLLIGVTSGSSELTVRGTTSGYNKNLITWERFSDGAVQGTLGFGKGIENNIYIGTITNHSLLFTTNDTERMRITSAGRLLLGTTTESTYLLDVNGTARVSGGTLSDLFIVRAGTTGQSIVNIDISTYSGDRVPLSVKGHSAQAYNYFQIGNTGADDIFRILQSGATQFSNFLSNRTAGNALEIRSNSAATTSCAIYYTSALTPTSGTYNILTTSQQQFNPTSGTAVLNAIQTNVTINQTGGANGITRGLYVNPTLTAAADWRSIEWSNNTGWGLYGAGTADNFIGGTLRVGQNASFNTVSISRILSISNASSVLSDREIQSTVTTAFGFRSRLYTATSAFTITDLSHFSAEAATPSGGATITNNYGFHVTAELTTATNNYGFYGNIPNAANRWNLYMNGTANNYMAGSLGIGTTNPSQKLHIYGSGNQNMFIENAGTYHIYVGISSNVGFIGSSNATPLQFTTNGIERLRITTTGNVGIGTTSPASTLDVSGTGRFSGSSNTILTLDSSNANGYTAVQINASATAKALIGYGTYLTTDGGVAIRTAASTPFTISIGSAVPNFTIGSTGAATFSSSVTATAFIPSGSSVPTNGMYLPTTNTLAWATNTTERMRLTSAGELLINTTTDAGDYKLQVAGNAYMTDSVVIGGTSSTTGSLDVYKGVLGVSANARFKVSGDYADAYQFRILGISAGNFNATTYASIDNSGNGYFAGNLGVGVVSPTEKLEVNGNIKTAAPSGGTAKPWKLGEVTGGTGTHNNSIKVEVDGSIYYLMAYVV